MPNVTIDGPIINEIEIKRELVKEITESLQRAYKLPIESFIVIINEHPSENVGVGGKLVSER